MDANRRAQVPVLHQTGPVAEHQRLLLVRLHGRNAEQWWEHEDREDRYNYLYSEEELVPLAKRSTRRGRSSRDSIYLNNHFAAQAVADAVVLRHLLDEPVEEPMPAELVRRYPVLEGKVAILPPSRLL